MKKLTLLAAVALLSGAAVAGEPHIGLDVGRTKIDDAGNGSMTGWSLFGGYRFDSNIAIEAGFRRLGSDKVGNVDVRGEALQLSAIGYVPLSTNVHLFARLGMNRIEAQARSYGSTYKDSENKVLFGLGFEYSLSQAVSLRTEFQKPASDVQVLSLGVKLAF
jgi:hypothetical protein